MGCCPDFSLKVVQPGAQSGTGDLQGSLPPSNTFLTTLYFLSILLPVCDVPYLEKLVRWHGGKKKIKNGGDWLSSLGRENAWEVFNNTHCLWFCAAETRLWQGLGMGARGSLC